MTGKTVVITGGNAGIGKQAAIALAKLGAKVVITSRDHGKGEAALAEIREASGNHQVECMTLDLASFASIEQFARDLLEAYPRIDVLILNAGLILDHRSETEEGFETTFGVNHLGHAYLTSLLRERLEHEHEQTPTPAPARIIVVSSDAHRAVPGGLDWDDLMHEHKFRGFEVYARSKLANILFTRALARRLDPSKVTVNALHPGTVRTRFARDGDLGGLRRFVFGLITPFMISADRGARTTVYLATAPELEGKTGGYYTRRKLVRPSKAARDDAAAERLWTITEALIAQANAARAT